MLVHNAAALQAWLVCLYEIESRAQRRYWIQRYAGSRGFQFVSSWIGRIHVTHPCCVSAPGLTGLPPSRGNMKVSRFPPLTKHYKVHHNIKQLFYRDPARPNNSFSLWNVLERFCQKEQEFFILLVSVRLKQCQKLVKPGFHRRH